MINRPYTKFDHNSHGLLGYPSGILRPSDGKEQIDGGVSSLDPSEWRIGSAFAFTRAMGPKRALDADAPVYVHDGGVRYRRRVLRVVQRRADIDDAGRDGNRQRHDA